MASPLHTIADSVLKRLRRSSLYYGHYNNTLPLRINRAYTRYASLCAAQYAAKHETQDLSPSPLKTTAAVLLQKAFTPERARQYSERIGALIDKGDKHVVRPEGEKHLQVQIRNPLEALDSGILDVLRSPNVDHGLRSFFQGYYRVEACAASRTFPAEGAAGSWLWHSDSFPPFTCKLFLHLTETNAETGATEFMDLTDTMAYRRAGYFGQFLDERYAGLEEFANEHGLPYRPFHFEAKPGDATLFNMNFFHRAVSPRRDFRDVVQFFFLPSEIPWDAFHALHPDHLTTPKKSGFPNDPLPTMPVLGPLSLTH